MNRKRAIIAALSVTSLALIAAGLFLLLKKGEEALPPDSSGPEPVEISKPEPDFERFDPSKSSGPAVASNQAVASPGEEPAKPLVEVQKPKPKPEIKPEKPTESAPAQQTPAARIDTEQGGSISVHFKPENSVPGLFNSVTELMNKEEKSLADKVVGQLHIASGEDDMRFVYHRPAVPSDLHLSIQLEVFDKASNTVFRYVSDAGWLSNPAAYDPSEKDVEVVMEGIKNLKDKMAIVTVKAGDSSLTGEMAMYQILRDYDGSESVWAVHVSDNDSGSKTRSEIVNLQYSFFEGN